MKHYVMPWPDVQRRVFAYILDRLNLFSDFDPKKLEVSLWATSALRLQDVALDPGRLSNRGVSVSRASLREIRVQLSTNGVQIDACGLEIDAELYEPQPDLGLSILLDPLDSEMSRSDEQVGYGMGDTSGIVTKLADLALAQLTCRISEISWNLRVRGRTVLVEADSASLASNKTLHLEALRVAPSIFYTPDSMAGSTYFDTQEQVTPDLLRINSLMAEVKENSINLTVDKITVEAIPLLEIVLGLVDDFLLQQSSRSPEEGSNSDDAMRISETKVNEVVFFDEGHRFRLCQIHFENNHLVIDELDIPGVARCQPFLTIKPGLLVETPLPIAAQLEAPEYAYSLVERLRTTLTGLRPPPAAEPTHFCVKLPDLRVACGDIIVVIAPQVITHEEMFVPELSVVFRHGRAVADGLRWIWADALHMDSLNVILTTDSDSKSGENSNFSQFNVEELPTLAQNIYIDSFSVEKGSLSILGSVKAAGGKIAARIESKYKNSWFRCSVKANTQPWEIAIREVDAFVQLEEIPIGGQKKTENSVSEIKVLKTLIKVTIAGNMTFGHQLVTLRAPIDGSARYGRGKWAVHVPELRMYLMDELRSEILKARHITLAPMGTRVAQINVSVCADSWERIHRLIDSLSPGTPKRTYNVQPSEIDVLKDVDKLTFTEFLEEEDQPTFTTSSPELVIVDDYMDKSHHTPPKNYAWTLNIDHLTWQLFDGFDLQNVRRDLGEAIHRVEREPTPNRPDEIVGDVMYESIFVGGRPHEDLQTQVRDELGGKGYGRSRQPKVKLTVWGTSIAFRADNLSAQVVSLKVADLLPSSTFQHVLEFQGGSAALKLELETVGENPELRLLLKSEPISISLDQDMLEFLMRFFQFTSLPASRAPSPENEKPYFQRVEVTDVLMRISYHPKKMDYRGLRTSYAELLNLFYIDRARVTLKHCVLYGISGIDRVTRELFAVWGPEIRHNQLLRVLTGFGPLRSVARIGTSVRDGAGISTVRKTASGLYKVGTRLTQSRQR